MGLFSLLRIATNCAKSPDECRLKMMKLFEAQDLVHCWLVLCYHGLASRKPSGLSFRLWACVVCRWFPLCIMKRSLRTSWCDMTGTILNKYSGRTRCEALLQHNIEHLESSAVQSRTCFAFLFVCFWQLVCCWVTESVLSLYFRYVSSVRGELITLHHLLCQLFSMFKVACCPTSCCYGNSRIQLGTVRLLSCDAMH
jgi:hypothetical protein